MMKRILIFELFFFFGMLVHAHPIHVSLCNIEVEEDIITIAVKMFRDDFQLALQHNFGKTIAYDDLILPENKKIIDGYINNALNIVLNKKDSLKFKYNNTEMNEDAIWFYYTYETVKLKSMCIKNELLLDIYYDQTNLIIINYEGKQSGYRFNSLKTEQRIILP